MWIPKSEQDILSAIDAGDLVETANSDTKAALPAKDKSIEPVRPRNSVFPVIGYLLSFRNPRRISPT